MANVYRKCLYGKFFRVACRYSAGCTSRHDHPRRVGFAQERRSQRRGVFAVVVIDVGLDKEIAVPVECLFDGRRKFRAAQVEQHRHLGGAASLDDTDYGVLDQLVAIQIQERRLSDGRQVGTSQTGHYLWQMGKPRPGVLVVGSDHNPRCRNRCTADVGGLDVALTKPFRNEPSVLVTANVIGNKADWRSHRGEHRRCHRPVSRHRPVDTSDFDPVVGTREL
nr:hypothetical protein [Nocardia cerradoensis]